MRFVPWGTGGAHAFTVNRADRVRVLSGSPFLTIDRTWATTCSGGRERGTGRRSKRTMVQIRAEREHRVGRWRRLLDEGVYLSRAALARAEGVSRAAVTQGLGSQDSGSPSAAVVVVPDGHRTTDRARRDEGVNEALAKQRVAVDGQVPAHRRDTRQPGDVRQGGVVADA